MVYSRNIAKLPVGANSLHEYSIEHSVAKLVVSGTISRAGVLVWHRQRQRGHLLEEIQDMTKRIALFNHKGGVNKSTTIYYLGRL